MVTIETTIQVDEQGKATIQLPTGSKPGAHRALVVVFDEPQTAVTRPSMAELPRHDIPWPFPEGYTFRREDMYGDDGR